MGPPLQTVPTMDICSSDISLFFHNPLWQFPLYTGHSPARHLSIGNCHRIYLPLQIVATMNVSSSNIADLMLFIVLYDQKVHLHYFDACFLHNIGGVSGKRCYDSLSMHYRDKESCHVISLFRLNWLLTETLPILCIKHVSKYRGEADFLVL